MVNLLNVILFLYIFYLVLVWSNIFFQIFYLVRWLLKNSWQYFSCLHVFIFFCNAVRELILYNKDYYFRSCKAGILIIVWGNYTWQFWDKWNDLMIEEPSSPFPPPQTLTWHFLMTTPNCDIILKSLSRISLIDILTFNINQEIFTQWQPWWSQEGGEWKG